MENAPKRRFINANNAIYWKISFILLLILLLMIPNGFIQSLIRERQSNKYEVQNEIASSWGNRQTVSGPLLAIPYETKHINDDGKVWHSKHKYYLAPDAANIDAQIFTEVRKKSIYEEVLYTSNLTISGNFNLSHIEPKAEDKVLWEESTFILGIFDPSGINRKVEVSINDTNYKLSPGTLHSDVVSSGVHSYITLTEEDTVVKFATNLDLKGHYHLFFEPTAQTTTVAMHSDWSSPGFVGKSLADEREITKDGFTAKWKISEFNRAIPTIWTDRESRLGNSDRTFGVELIQPVDHYQKNMRSAKYALLIISLSFLAFFFFELILHKRLHPIQYTFIGLSLSIFYYLLLSISEHLGFDTAYLIASISVISLIILYTKSILGSMNQIWILAGILSLLYAYIFVLLQLEEYALIAGSIGLFIILATVMYLSRNINWYKPKESRE